MDNHHDNIDPEDNASMNGRHESAENAAQNEVFSKLFAMDQQPDPSPRFVAQLGRSLMPSAGKMTLLSATTSVTEPIPESRPIAEAAGGGKRRRPIISFGSAAVLMVIVVLVGYAVTLWAVDNSNNPPAYMAFGSTFEASETAAAEGIAGCVAPPRSVQDITGIVNTAVYQFNNSVTAEAGLDSVDATHLFDPPPGTPVSGNVVSELHRVFEVYVNCLNSRDYLRAYGVFTDDGVARQFFSNGRINIYGIALISSAPQEGFGDREPQAFDRVEQLPDGRMIAYYPNEYSGNDDYFHWAIFKNVDGTWFIDEIQEGQG
jgi:hypothetical protein